MKAIIKLLPIILLTSCSKDNSKSSQSGSTQSVNPTVKYEIIMSPAAIPGELLILYHDAYGLTKTDTTWSGTTYVNSFVIGNYTTSGGTKTFSSMITVSGHVSDPLQPRYSKGITVNIYVNGAVVQTSGPQQLCFNASGTGTCPSGSINNVPEAYAVHF